MPGDPLFPVWLSLRVSLCALALTAPAGVALAWVQASRRYRFRSAVDALILLPMVLPPSVVGFSLVWLFGRRGAVGQLLDRVGVRIIFTPAAAVMAAAIVALPMVVKTAQPAMEAVPLELIDVGRSLGLPPLELFLRVTLRGAWRGVATGLVLAFVRALGEFGATLMFAGDIPGRTNTMPIEIFSAYQAGDDARALVYVSLLTAACTLTALCAGRFAPVGKLAG